MITLISHL